MKHVIFIFLFLILATPPLWAKSTSPSLIKKTVTKVNSKAKRVYESPIFDITVTPLLGKPQTLGNYKGKVLLIVNIATKTKNKKQIDDLEDLQEDLGRHGLVVLAFPSNDFGAGTPVSNQALRKIVTHEYFISYPVFTKTKLRGKNMHPLFRYLTSKKTNPKYGGPIAWNFDKFLVNRKGEIIGRFSPSARPGSDKVLAPILEALNLGKRAKKKGPKTRK
ncbi:MAG: glutathione peroxidase [Candidatus Marinamargulisbacteria bacterium]|jgi:glutathione peroxidase